ncbi:hypothetical protein ScPMuIL_014605 [Solemya velum]
MASKEKWEDLNLSNDEIKRLGEALKDEKFRKLFVEYAEEISNPENRRLYEEDIRRMENDRGSDIQFIHPEPGHVLKTSVDGEMKAFINISKSDKLDKPGSRREKNAQGQSGLHWTIPHSFAPPREDLDKNNTKCKVFDVVFHPDTYRLAESNKKFMKMVEDTALDGIEQRFEVKLDRQNIKRPNMKFKGTPMPTVTRSKLPNAESDGKPKVPDEDDPLRDMPYPYGDIDEGSKSTKPLKTNAVATKKEEVKPIIPEPKYSITHRTDLDLQEYRNAPDARTSTRPKEVIIKIELPLLSSASQGNLDVFDDRILFESKHPAAYKLDLKLPYPVDDENGSAKFDKSKRCLIVTLPVIKAAVPEMPFVTKGNVSKSMDNDKDVENENVSKANPLIEVMSQSGHENESLDELLISNDQNEPIEDTSAVYSIESLNDLHTENKVAPCFPDFTYNQDDETVTYIFPIKNVLAESVSKFFRSADSCWVKFISMGSGGFPINYSFCVTFPPACLLVPEECSVDVSATNVVLLLLKERSCRYLWDVFAAGVNFDDGQEEHLFVTEANLQHELNQLQAEAENLNIANLALEPLQVEVSEMSKKQLTLKVKRSTSIEEEEENDELNSDQPLSSDIEVIQSKTQPGLQGILKQRSISESSDDIWSQSTGSYSSPSSSPRDEIGTKKICFFLGKSR